MGVVSHHGGGTLRILPVFSGGVGAGRGRGPMAIVLCGVLFRQVAVLSVMVEVFDGLLTRGDVVRASLSLVDDVVVVMGMR